MEFDLNDISDELIVINKITIEKLFQEKNLNVLILYMFYYKTAKWQNTNQIKANDDYCKSCLHWGIDKLKCAKLRLKEMGLIEVVKKLNKNNQIEGWYVKINYHSSTIPDSTQPILPQVGQQETNAYNNNIKCLNIIEMLKKENNKLKSLLKETEKKTSKFIKPTVEEIKEYCSERKNKIEAEYFYDYYESNGWKVGRNPMKDWKATIRTWEKNEKEKVKANNTGVIYEQI